MPTVPLANDIIFLIFCHLDVQSLLNVRLVCHEFHDLTKLRSLWQILYQKHITPLNIPIPSRQGEALESLPPRQLEVLFHRTLKLHQNWTSSTPVIRRQCTFTAWPSTRVIAVHFLPCQSWRWLISLSLTMDGTRRFVLQTWDLMVSPPICIGTKEFRHFRGMAVNDASTEHAVIVLNPTIEVLSPTLTTLAVFHDEPGGMLLYSGSRFITRSPEARIYMYDLEEPELKVELCNPELMQHLQTRDVLVFDDFALVLRVSTLEIYALPPDSETAGEQVVYPVAKFQWPWKVDSAEMTIQPINLLHHYELHSDPSYQASEPPSSVNLPYKFPPVLRETIGSPVRLHATSVMAMGPYGTAIWTDSHTEDYFEHPDQGQRLAGKFTPGKLPFVGQGGDEETELSEQVATSMATSVYAFQEKDSWVSVALDETEGKIALGHDQGQITILEYV